MQAYAAVCLWRFCEHWRIRDDSVRQAVSYLFSITLSESLPEWDQQAVGKAIIGRYQDVSTDLLDSVPEDARASFLTLVNECSEVGWVDMYGKDSGQPLQHLRHCLDVLRRHNIDLPKTDPLRHLQAGFGHWGDAVNLEQAKAALSEYDIEGLL